MCLICGSEEVHQCEDCGRIAWDVTLQKPCEESDSTAYLCDDHAACNQRCREAKDDLALNAADVPYVAETPTCLLCRKPIDDGDFDVCAECSR